MNIITIKLIEKHIDLPFDIVLFINEYVKPKIIKKYNIHNVVKLWFSNKESCIFHYGHISEWDVSNITSMYSLFYLREYFNEDISKWNVSNVVNMACMFDGAKNFNRDISKWDVSNVKDMNYMFFRAENFNSDISKWNVSNVKNMYAMFCYATNFNCDISNWNVSNVEDMSFMFCCANSFNINIDISKWYVTNVKQTHSMFSHSFYQCDIPKYNYYDILYDIIDTLTDFLNIFIDKCVIDYIFYNKKERQNQLRQWKISKKLKKDAFNNSK